MLKHLDVPGYGQAIAGLDWLTLDGLESQGTEIRQLARSSNAAWQILWPAPVDEHEKRIAFVTKAESKAKPRSAAVLLTAAIPDSTFLSLITLDDPDSFWVFALAKGMPAKRMDFVGSVHDAMNLVRDFLTSQPSSQDLPVYTDQPELFLELPNRMDLRSMSVEILSHSIESQDYVKAAFKRYSPVSLPLVITVSLLAAAVVGYLVNDAHVQVQRKRDAAQARAQEQAQNLARLQQAIDAGINLAMPIDVLQEYTDSLHKLPVAIGGWRLAGVVCQASQCMARYSAQPLATWLSYSQLKPAQWPEPELGSDIDQIEQPIPVALAHTSPRKLEQLQLRSRLNFEIGNLAQVARLVGVSLETPSSWESVTPATGPGAETVQVPVRASFSATGPAYLLRDFARRLPPTIGITEVSFSLKDTTTFALKGEAYARP